MSLWHESRAGFGRNRWHSLLWLIRIKFPGVFGGLSIPCLQSGVPCAWGDGPGKPQPTWERLRPEPMSDLTLEVRDGTTDLTARGLLQVFQESAECGGANVITTWHDAESPMRFQFNFISRRTMILGRPIASRGDHVQMRAAFTLRDDHPTEEGT